MDLQVKQKFIELWATYFGTSDLPLAIYYTDDAQSLEPLPAPSGHRCLICELGKARHGRALCFNADSIACGGGRRYLGFSERTMPNFEYFLSFGLPGKVPGERYKKSPQLVKQTMSKVPRFKAPAKFIIIKRWDKLDQSDNPEVVVFFARPDVLSGLFTLANFDRPDLNGVFVPFGAACASIVQYPYLERDCDYPRAVLGMFDVSARPYVPAGLLSFAVPMNKFIGMLENMAESFLITPAWGRVRKRIAPLGDQPNV